MTPVTNISLIEQRVALRRELLAQRQLIARRLEVAPAGGSEYPRSMVMRFLVQRPALTGTLFAGLGTLLVGTRFFRSMTTALALTRILRSRQAQQPVQTAGAADLVP
jgi:hypothetical protein